MGLSARKALKAYRELQERKAARALPASKVRWVQQAQWVQRDRLALRVRLVRKGRWARQEQAVALCGRASMLQRFVSGRVQLPALLPACRGSATSLWVSSALATACSSRSLRPQGRMHSQ